MLNYLNMIKFCMDYCRIHYYIVQKCFHLLNKECKESGHSMAFQPAQCVTFEKYIIYA